MVHQFMSFFVSTSRLRFFFFSLLLLIMGTANSDEKCIPHHYADGDTFYFNNADGSEVRVRVAGFDAPERGQPFSHVATEKMRSLIHSGADCSCYKKDRYKRSVCTVRTLTGNNVATVMLAAGLGCIDKRFENEASALDRNAARKALEDAQNGKKGMWSNPNPICGAEYRRSKK